VVLVSLDGFQADYLDRYPVPRLKEFFAKGVRAEGLIPIFPSKTYPNHWTLVTGLYAEHHGVVANRMFDERDGARFAYGNPSEFAERWWGGEPIWLTVQRQGGRAATMFWPGSQVELHGQRPAFWRPYFEALPSAGRLMQVVEWISLPEGRRPQVAVVYLEDVDAAGHTYGPDSPETARAVSIVDEAFGLFIDELSARGLLNRTHIIVLSDHGMASTPPDRVLFLEDYIDLTSVDVIDWSPVLALRARDGNHEASYRALANRHPALKVYRKADVPTRFHYRSHPHIPPVIGIADEGWVIEARRAARLYVRDRGQHGYDNQLRSMLGIFLARGPRIVEAQRVPAIENVHVYALLCELAAVTPAANDGSIEAVRSVLRAKQPASSK
jgi:predicted AlkP superfamily pyrophosphatase or phosphodiesterase